MKSVITVLGIGIALSLTIGTRSAAAQAPDDGAALYKQHCRTCHGATGTPTQRMVGLYPTLKSFTDTSTLAGVSADSIVAILKKGMGKDMKSFSDKLTPDQMAAVARYVKTLGHSAGNSQ
ncbi:MAG TPA: c-type cytochrome [Gemmatimonadales bacterium]|nr:c-type cytochrome [Gemmatimonadales bacterium]